MEMGGGVDDKHEKAAGGKEKGARATFGGIGFTDGIIVFCASFVIDML
jgi:hypothetical protein